jgi:hypothetical protein
LVLIVYQKLTLWRPSRGWPRNFWHYRSIEHRGWLDRLRTLHLEDWGNLH